MSGSSSSATDPATDPNMPTGRISNPTVPNIKLDRFPRLRCQDDYRTWRDAAEHILRTMGCWGIVANNERIPTKREGESDDRYEERADRYDARCSWAQVFILDTVDFEWLPLITANKTPFNIWKALQDQFDRENTVGFHSQLASLLSLRVTSKSDLASTITKFNAQWTRLNTRCSTARETDEFALPYDFQGVFQSPRAKAAYLLLTLPPSMSNIRDNLMTKDNLSYEQCYQRLMDLTTEEDGDSDKAYTTTKTTSRSKGTGKPPATTSGTKEFTWCAKHHPKANNKGYSWNECNKLKAFNEKRKKDREGKGKEEVARVSKESNSSETVGTPITPSSSPYPFTPDTAANCFHTSYPPSKTTPSTRWIHDTGASCLWIGFCEGWNGFGHFY